MIEADNSRCLKAAGNFSVAEFATVVPGMPLDRGHCNLPANCVARAGAAPVESRKFIAFQSFVAGTISCACRRARA